MGKKTEAERKVKEYRQAVLPLIAAGYVLIGYIYLLVLVYPFMIRPGYADTSFVKYDFLIGTSFAYIAGPLWIPTFVPLCLILIAVGTALYIGKSGKGLLGCLRTWHFSVTDMMVGLYALFVVISSVLSPYKDEIVWGYPTWNMGLVSQFLFIFIYFIASRFFDRKYLKDLVYTSLFASGAVFVIGILQRFGLDIFDLYQDIEKRSFISTIGNPNFFSSYMIIFLMIGIFTVWISDTESILYKAGMVHVIIGAIVLPLQNSDMAYAGLFAGMSFLFVMSFDAIERMKAFGEITLVILISWRLTGIAWYLADPAYRLNKMSLFMISSPLMWLIIAAFLPVYLWVRRKNAQRVRFDISVYKRIGRIYAWTVMLVIILLVVYIILNTKKILPEAVRTKDRYLRFNRKWGSGRGAILHDTVLSCISAFKHETAKVLFGTGPDMFYHFIEDNTHKWVEKSFKEKTLTNAHNEWLTALVNYGLFGGLAYMGIFISSFVRCIKDRMRSPLVTGVAAVVIAYFAHDIFCFQQYVNTPYIFIIMGIGEYMCRTKAEEKA